MRIPALVLVLSLPAALAPAGPAARIGDPTSHGGAVAAGSPTVFIDGLPAARLGDFATCPVVNAGNPPVPHVGGPIAAGSATVFIGGLPAARLGDPIVEAASSSVIAGGSATVLIGP